MISRKEHWNNIYSDKQRHAFSWNEEVPKTSLAFIQSLQLPKHASIIDIGGGDSRLVDHLIDEGFQNITVLDISEKAIERTKNRLGEKALGVKWIVSDVMDFAPDDSYDCWHDRATFHFLTDTLEVKAYLEKVIKSVNRFLVIGTFSEEGPDKCSLLDVHQYSENALQELLKDGFKKIKCIKVNHITPFNATQNFLFCSFRRFND